MTVHSLAVIPAPGAPAQATPLPTILSASLSDWCGEWDSRHALSLLKRDGLAHDVPALVAQARALCQPMPYDRMRKRLILLGTAMAPNRSKEEAGAWLDHMMRGLAEYPEDLLLQAVEAHCKVSRFPPAIADIVELAQGKLDDRRREAMRLETIERLIASGADVPAARPHPAYEPRPEFDPATRCTPEQARAILAELGMRSSFTDKLAENLGGEHE